MMFDTGIPASKADIIQSLNDLSVEIASYMDSLPLAVFLEKQGDRWSPSGHLRHLVKSIRSLSAGMRYPRLILRILFGSNKGTLRSFEEIVAVYRDALAAGGQSSARYIPADNEPDIAAEEWREITMNRWAQANRELTEAIMRWDESAMDTYRLPHPLLGKLTIREMLFFTIYHNRHHAKLVEERAVI